MRRYSTGLLVSLALHALAFPGLYFLLAHSQHPPKAAVSDSIQIRFIANELLADAPQGAEPGRTVPASTRPDLPEPLPATAVVAAQVPAPPTPAPEPATPQVTQVAPSAPAEAVAPPPEPPKAAPEPVPAKPEPVATIPEPKVVEVAKAAPGIPVMAVPPGPESKPVLPASGGSGPASAPVALKAPGGASSSTSGLAGGPTKGLVNGRPRYKSSPEPIYPSAARRRRQEGVVLLRVKVSASGKPEKVEVLKSSGFASLDEAAAATVKSWDFEPGFLDGRPVATTPEVPIRFKLDR